MTTNTGYRKMSHMKISEEMITNTAFHEMSHLIRYYDSRFFSHKAHPQCIVPSPHSKTSTKNINAYHSLFDYN